MLIPRRIVHVKMPENSKGLLLLRIYAHHKEIDFDWVRKHLRLGFKEPEISNATDEPDHDMLVIVFSEQLTLLEGESSKKGGLIPFGNATSWLRKQPEATFEEIEGVGLRADIAISGGYWGPVPDDFLREVVRCRLHLYIL